MPLIQVPGGQLSQGGEVFPGSSWRSLVWLGKGQSTGRAPQLIVPLSEASFLLLSNEEGPLDWGSFRNCRLLSKDSKL